MTRQSPGSKASALQLRCAIYTRKSSEEGLEQFFNSLDAQREACEAYIMSQTGEGWTALPAHYDDGGFSGSNMERPGLKQLLADIALRTIDVVVVYKVDRLTRSLADFARIVDVLDQNGVSFVSVTQAFNTTSSMGRLTLNVLLSFAQFEREVTGERIRDKIAASKKKGMWMGGTRPLGYRPHERTLVIDPDEAATVRSIFSRYLDLGSVHLLKDELAAQGIRSRPSTRTAPEADPPFSRGALYYLLSNRIYVGEIVHKDASYPGQHEPIIERAVFEQVQALLAENRKERRDRKVAIARAPLTGILFDSQGRRLCPVSTRNQRGHMYRYYVSAHLQQGGRRVADDDHRISAPALEATVLDALQGNLPGSDWNKVRNTLTRVIIDDTSAVIRFRRSPGSPEQDIRVPTTFPPWAGICKISRPSQARPHGSVNHSLVRALSRAHGVVRSAKTNPERTLKELAGSTSSADSYVRRLARLAFLAPDIQQTIVEGHQPSTMSLEHLMRVDLPLSWERQRRMLGF
jgi:DNA invertase Pin-like site-specific DNA recombinase